jgi:hypothetical protein
MPANPLFLLLAPTVKGFMKVTEAGGAVFVDCTNSKITI